MKLAVRTTKIGAVKMQLQSSLQLEEVNIVAVPTKYSGITILNLDESAVATFRSIRNIEALLLDGASVAELLQPTTARDAPSLTSLDRVDEREQYEHLSQVLHMQKAMSDKR